jgi:hypothetical protein
MRHEKKTSESKHPSSCTKRGKIKLEVYGNRDGGVEFKRPRPPLAVSIDFM